MIHKFRFYMKDGSIVEAYGRSYADAFETLAPFKDEYTSQVDHWEVVESKES